MDLARSGFLSIFGILLGLVHLDIQAVGDLGAHRGEERVVYGGVQLVCPRVGDLGRDGPRLLVYVILQLGAVEIVGHDACNIGAELSGDHEGGVSLPRVHTVHGGIVIDEGPMQLVVAVQLIHYVLP